MFITKTHRRNPISPVDRAAWQQLQDAYAACKTAGEGTKRQPWSPASCVHLGRLFFAAWGQLPSHSRLRPEYAMPPWRTIQRRWGSLQAYHNALIQCGCTSGGARCVEAAALHTAWQRGQRGHVLLDDYRAHLQTAGVWPGKAAWSTQSTEVAHG